MAYEEIHNQVGAPSQQKIEYRSCDWCSLGAAAGLGGGVVTALSGSVLTALSWFGGTASHPEKVLGSVLLVLTIPLLIIGAQCLDALDEKKDRARETRFKEKK